MRTLIPYWSNRNTLNAQLFNEMDRMFDDLVAPRTPIYDERQLTPATEVIETENHYLLSVDLPGLKKEDIQIDMSANTLTISGERKRETRTEAHQVQRADKSLISYKKSFVLPTSVAGDKIEAKYENGVLELYLPKTQLAQSRKIEIQESKSGFFNKILGKTEDKEPPREG